MIAGVGVVVVAGAAAGIDTYFGVKKLGKYFGWW